VRRIYVVTGSASGIGAATRSLLEGDGHVVIGVDLHDADIVLDLANPIARRTLPDRVRGRASPNLNGVIACAGIGGVDPSRTAEESAERARRIVAVNYFGAIETLAGLRPMLAGADTPGAAVVSSIVSPVAVDEPLIAACLDGDESHALELASRDEYRRDKRAYAMAKRAVARWVRRMAPLPDWAGAGISLNAVGPAVVDTPMGSYLLDTAAKRATVTVGRPMPLRGHADPGHIGSLLVWLTGTGNGFVTGQMIFADGGHDAVVRGDNTW
jgi:NAD(P)-dependent dehydrogenase (short-subunit alcohol dehydrogenase family)